MSISSNEKTIEKVFCSGVTYHRLPHWVVFRHPSFELLSNRVNKAVIVDEFR